MKAKIILFSFCIILILCFSKCSKEIKKKTIIAGCFVKNEACETHLSTLPPGTIFNGKDPCNLSYNKTNDKLRIFTKREEFTPNPDSTFRIELELSKTNYARIGSIYNWIYLILNPGDSIFIHLDDNKDDNPYTIYGNNSESQMLYNKLKLARISSRGFKSLEDVHNDSMLTKMNTIIQNEKAPFDKLYKLKKIDRNFYNLVSTEIEYYYAYQVTQTLTYRFRSETDRNKDNSNIIEALRTIYKQYPTYCKHMVMPCYGFDQYVLNYIWLQYYFEEKEFNLMKDDQSNHQKTFEIAKDNLSKDAYEYFVLDLLKNYAYKRDTIILSIYKEYQETYPISNYPEKISKLESEINALKVFKDLYSKPYDKDIIIEDYQSINSLDDIVTVFNGKPVYIDLWAVWCSPCRYLFKYNDQVKEILYNNGVKMLYISIDEDEGKWKNAIKEFQLSGHHILANKLLIENLKAETNWDGGVPHFIIIDSHGKIKYENVAYPYETDELTDQLSNI